MALFTNHIAKRKHLPRARAAQELAGISKSSGQPEASGSVAKGEDVIYAYRLKV